MWIPFLVDHSQPQGVSKNNVNYQIRVKTGGSVYWTWWTMQRSFGPLHLLPLPAPQILDYWNILYLNSFKKFRIIGIIRIIEFYYIRIVGRHHVYILGFLYQLPYCPQNVCLTTTTPITQPVPQTTTKNALTLADTLHLLPPIVKLKKITVCTEWAENFISIHWQVW